MATNVSAVDPQAYYRCWKALHLIAKESVNCVDSCLKNWHTTTGQSIPLCTSQCPSGKKPKLLSSSQSSTSRSSCKSCVDWGNAIESVFFQTPYPPSSTNVASAVAATQKPIPWVNVNPSRFGISHVEVAKAFVLRLQKGQSLQNYTSLSEFDIAGIFVIMMRFSEFHKGDKNCYSLVEKVVSIRNDLGHMAVKRNQEIPPATVGDYFKDIDGLVCWLQNKYSTIFPSCVRKELQKIQHEPITEDIQKEIVQDIAKEVEGIAEHVKVIDEKMEDIVTDAHQTDERLDILEGSLEHLYMHTQRPEHLDVKVEELSAATKTLQDDLSMVQSESAKTTDVAGVADKVEELSKAHEGACGEMEAVRAAVQELSISGESIEKRLEKTTVKTENVGQRADELSKELKGFQEVIAEREDDELPFQLEDCRNQLKSFYRHSRGTIPLLPGMPEKFGRMKNIFVNLQLFYEEKASKEMEIIRLQSHTDLLSLKDCDNHKVNRVLIKGDAGGGKTVTLSKIAYDWATCDPSDELFSKFGLVLLLELRSVQPQMTLAEAVQCQLLPRVSKRKLLTYIETHADSVVILLDGFDEALWLGERSLREQNEFKILLNNKWLYKSHVITTSRRHRVSNYIDQFGPSCAQVELMQFSFTDVKEFVARFFDIDSIYLYGADDYNFSEIHSEVDEYIKESIVVQSSLSLLPRIEYTLRQREHEDTVKKVLELVFPFLRQLLNNPVMKALSKRPILLAMMCMFPQISPERTTDIFEHILEYFGTHSFWRCEDERIRDVPVILTSIGKVALNGLLSGVSEPKLEFVKDDFPEDILNDALKLGILVMDRMFHNRRVQHRVTFLHREFQEFCAAKYMIELLNDNMEKFKEVLGFITNTNIIDMFPFMQYCCGLSVKATEMILPHFVDTIIAAFPKSDRHPTFDCTVSSSDPWILCLVLLAESRSDTSGQFIKPLLQRKSLSIKLGENKDYLPALEFFITSQKKLGKEGLLWDIIKAIIIVKRHSEVVKRVLNTLLDSVPNLFSLEIELPPHHVIMFVIALTGRLISHLRHLKHLTLRGPGDFNDIIAYLKTPNVTHLTIACTCFNVEKLRGYMHNLKRLTHLSLVGQGDDGPVHRFPDFMLEASYNGMKINVLPLFADNALSCLKSNKLRNLSIVDCNISPFYLRPHLPILYTLHLESFALKNTNDVLSVIHDEAMKASKISTAKRQKSPLPLKHLRLNCSPTELSIGNVRLLVNMFRFLPHLTILNLRELQITEDGFLLIAKGLPYLSRLKEINLSNNKIGKSSKVLCEHLRRLEWLEKLLLRRVSLDRDGIRSLSNSLNDLENLKVLNLHGNRVGNGVVNLCPSFQRCGNLEELDLTDTQLSDDGIQQLPFTHMKRLTTLCISGQHLIQGTLDSHNDNRNDVGTDVAAGNTPSWAVRAMDAFAGVSQCYGPHGIKTIFENLRHLESLTHLEIKYNGRWNRNDEFLEKCCRECLYETDKIRHMNLHKLVLKRKEIDAVIAFVEEHKKRDQSQ